MHTSRFNSLSAGKFEWKFRYVILKRNLVMDGWGISCEIALIWTSLDFTDDQSTLVQVMAWCCQATSHYLSQCWPRSLSPYGVTRPQYFSAAPIRLFSYFQHFLIIHACSNMYAWLIDRIEFQYYSASGNGYIIKQICGPYFHSCRPRHLTHCSLMRIYRSYVKVNNLLYNGLVPTELQAITEATII